MLKGERTGGSYLLAWNSSSTRFFPGSSRAIRQAERSVKSQPVGSSRSKSS